MKFPQIKTFCFFHDFPQEASGFAKSFVTWMGEHKELREMIAIGKDRLEWTRKVDQSQVNINTNTKTNTNPHLHVCLIAILILLLFFITIVLTTR